MPKPPKLPQGMPSAQQVLDFIQSSDIPAGKRAHGFYIDELGEGFLVEDNLAVNCAWPVHMHMATANTLRNNIFLNDGEIQLTFPRCHGFVLDRNVIVAGGPIQVENPEGVSAWTNNLILSRAGRYDQVANGVEKGEPCFVDATKQDFRFQAGSPALGLGIKPLGFSQVGPRGRAAP